MVFSMVRISNYLLLNKCLRYILLVLALLFPYLEGKTQSLSLIHKIPLVNEPVAVSIDRSDNVFIADTKGNLFKYDKHGKLLFTYSPNRSGSIKNVEASASLNVLLFYEGLQECRFLNRFLTPTSVQKLNPDIFARLVTISSDNNLWVFDDKDFSLKKLNLHLNTFASSTSLTDVIKHDFQGKFLKEYQHFVFLSDIPTGIYVFDNLGNYIKTLPFPKVQYFNFLDNKLYFLRESTIHFYELYTGEETAVAIPSKENYWFALASKDQLFLVSKKNLDIYVVGD